MHLSSEIARPGGPDRRAVATCRLLTAVLVPVLFLFSAASALAKEARVALVIGNGAYRYAGKLPNPARDALAMAAKLKSLGFSVDLAIDQGHAGMAAAFRGFAPKLRGADVALLFYAGHGLQVMGRNYLIPVDAKLAVETDLEFQALDLERVLEPIQSQAKVGLIFLDACRNNPLANNLRASSRAVGRGLAITKATNGEILIVYATSPDREAEDGKGSNSPFTTALLRHIDAAGVEVQTMIKRVIGSVDIATSGRQRPWQNASLSTEIYLAGRGATQALLNAKKTGAEPSMNAPDRPDQTPTPGTITNVGLPLEESLLRTGEQPQSPAGSAAGRRPLYKKWWFWTLIGGAVAASAVGLGVGLSVGLADSPLMSPQVPSGVSVYSPTF